MRVFVSDHALQRYRERAAPATRRAVRKRVARHLLAALRAGLQPDPAGAVHVEIGDGLWAVCAPMLQGGWAVVTVYVPGEEVAVL